MLIWIAYIGAVVALAAFVTWWILLALALPILVLPGLMRKARVMQVLAEEFDYEFSATSPQASTLNQMMKSKQFKGYSAEDVATYFMAVMVNTLQPSSTEEIGFSIRVLSNATRLRTRGVISDEAINALAEVVNDSRA